MDEGRIKELGQKLAAGRPLTIEALLALTEIRACDDCGSEHAPVRGCEEGQTDG